MKTENDHEESFDEAQSIQVIREMIQVSQNKLKNDGILFLVWGWSMAFYYFFMFLQREWVTIYSVSRAVDYMVTILPVPGLIFTLSYFLKQRKKVQTYLGVSLRYIWTAAFFCLVLINLIQFNVLHQINFELQHPVFMVIVAFAIVSTGIMIRYRFISLGGIAFGLLAYLSSYLDLSHQLLLEAIAWVFAFIIPGHILYSQRKKE